MTARLSRLRIAGFKSFAEPVSLEILPGLTGIVGPNGCGKSNVVEALRWAMGETSARSLRGGEMDDVIFAGTTARASRNLAEVTITLERTEDAALPAPFEADSELQVTRRIERGAGSQFRANGRELRARDVQTLYADLASGARSSGMVSQGRVSALVNARPEERRQVLEEAAGITGLHARRHEAELKLRAAEQNIARAEDARGQIEGAREAMRKQARQAARYRGISGLIRAAETEHLAVLFAAAGSALERAGRDSEAAAEAARCAGGAMAAAEAALADAEAALPGPRAALSAAERILERRRIEAEGRASEAARAAREAEAAASRLAELQADLAAAAAGRADAGASVARLDDAARRLDARASALPAEIASAASDAASALLGLEAAGRAEAAAVAASREAALAMAAARAAAQSARLRVETVVAQHAAAVAACAAAEAGRVAPERLSAASGEVAGCEAALAGSRAALERGEVALAAAIRAHDAAREAAARAAAVRAAAARALAEADAQADRLGQAGAAARGAVDALMAARVPDDAVAAARALADRALAMAEAGERALDTCEAAASRAQQDAAAAARGAEDLGERHRRAAEALGSARLREGGLRAEHEGAQAAYAAAAALGPGLEALARAAAADDAAARALVGCADDFGRMQAGRQAAAAALAAARAVASGAQAEAARVASEAAGLDDVLGEAAGQASALLAIDVPEGLEAALGAALGDGGEASLQEDAVRFWRAMAPDGLPALPDGSVALGSLVTAPAALARLLGCVALIGDDADGDAIQVRLAPGTVAVRRDGACWRWDGHVTRAGAPNAAARRLLHRRRLAAARLAAADAAAAAVDAVAALDAAIAADAEAAEGERRARGMLAGAEGAARAARAELDRLSAAAAQSEALRAALLPGVQRLDGDLAQAELALGDAGAALAALPALPPVRAAAAAAAEDARASAERLDAARAARVAARDAAVLAQDEAGRLEARAAEVAMRLAVAAPGLAELEAQHAAALQRREQAAAGLAALPDEAGLRQALLAAAADEAGRREAEATCRDVRRRAERALDVARAAAAALGAACSEAEGRCAACAAQLAGARAELAQAEAALAGCAARVEALDDPAVFEAGAAVARTALERARGAAQAADMRHAGLLDAAVQVRASREAVNGDLLAWRGRAQAAREREDALAGRCAAARTAWQALSTAPDAAAAQAVRSDAALAAAQADHASAAARAQDGEQRVRAMAMALRDGEQRLSACREAALRDAAALEAAAGAVRGVLARAAERLGADAVLPAAAEVSDAAEERARRRFERLTRERDEMGPVNLRAEIELAELDLQAQALERDCAELATAIAKLRGSIGHLNREGRARLTAVFTEVDGHFRTLFTRMMGGGRAHLALTGSEDPLSAGLEIYAEPPGKKLASLALLSGGEQALTALSLIFAVFRCTPSPVSVLDEVDAPLDDANVERFCTLLDDVVRETGTRFLVVTHHQLTMSRMDRLFGVTMQERGVSRLLSVDLHGAAGFVEAGQVLAAE